MRQKPLTLLVCMVTIIIASSCQQKNSDNESFAEQQHAIVPVVITEPTENDTDDPAIWYNRTNPEKSLILGTDKGDSTGGIYVFDLQGKIDTKRTIRNLYRPNNIDIRYDFSYRGKKIDIAVFTERGKDRIRVISLPDCQFIDNGGIEVFKGDSIRSPMGIALYRNPKGEIFAFVSRKSGPELGYIHQLQLVETAKGVTGKFIRAFGAFSKKKEIEAMVVDDETGFLYYCDEGVGIRKYYADAAAGDQELALFGTTGFAEDHEGISIVPKSHGKGYIIVSDQQSNRFQIFAREGEIGNPHQHKLIRTVKASTNESDGSDAFAKPLGKAFPNGIFVAMSNDRTFQYYLLEDLLGN